MAGHSKWANIQRRKGAQDAKRAKAWTKVTREITVAARMGGGDPTANPRLRDAVALAKSHNMPKDNIERAIAKGTGESGAENIEEVTYEGYGPGGAAIYLEAMTDNRNRTVADVRHIFSKNGGSLGETGCVNWMFTKKGLLEIGKEGISEERLFEDALEIGAEDISEGEAGFEITCAANELSTLREGLEAQGYKVIRFEVIAEPSSTVELSGENAEKTLKLLELLDEHDDIQHVHSNADFIDE